MNETDLNVINKLLTNKNANNKNNLDGKIKNIFCVPNYILKKEASKENIKSIGKVSQTPKTSIIK